MSEVRYNWPLYLFTVCFPILMAFFMMPFARGEEKGFLLGALGVTGISTAGVMALLMSGAASILMGLHAEEWTARRFRPLRRRGWRLINGLQLRPKIDIDHVVIGPTGLIVIETKWSSESWPTSKSGTGFMESALRRAVEQVSGNCHDIENNFKRVIGDAPVRRACVLWTSNAGSGSENIWNYDGVTIVPGSCLGLWIASLDEIAVENDHVLEIWKEIADHATSRDKYDAGKGLSHRPSLQRLALTTIVSPMVGAFVALYASLGIARLGNDWPITLSLVAAFLALGILDVRFVKTKSIRFDWIKPAMYGWIVASGFTLLLFIGLVLKAHFA